LIHFLKQIFNNRKIRIEIPQNIKGVKHETNILNIKSLEPNKFIQVSFSKQSYETNIS